MLKKLLWRPGILKGFQCLSLSLGMIYNSNSIVASSLPQSEELTEAEDIIRQTRQKELEQKYPFIVDSFSKDWYLTTTEMDWVLEKIKLGQLCELRRATNMYNCFALATKDCKTTLNPKRFLLSNEKEFDEMLALHGWIPWPDSHVLEDYDHPVVALYRSKTDLGFAGHAAVYRMVEDGTRIWMSKLGEGPLVKLIGGPVVLTDQYGEVVKLYSRAPA